MGWEEKLSAYAAIFRISLSGRPLRDIISATSGFPYVIVPVLSKTTALILAIYSRLEDFLISMPFSKPIELPTIRAIGVASPIAQGQAITKTAMEADRANKKFE